MYYIYILAGDYLYIFGGSLSYGEFSNQMYRIHSQNLTEWELIKPKGKISDLYITGHSMVYYEEQQSLLLFGGFRTDVGRFAQLSGEKGKNKVLCKKKYQNSNSHRIFIYRQK